MKGHLVHREQLAPGHRHAMRDLLCRHFQGIDEIGFERDLAEKNWAVLIEDDEGRLRGFTTLLFYRREYRGRSLGVICSGDTIVDRGARHSRALLTTWLRAALWLGRGVRSSDLYWLLICSGYRTYHFLPLFFRSYHPRRSPAVPSPSAELMHLLAAERWGGQYDRKNGIVRFTRPQVLRPEISPVTERLLARPDIAFFIESNPGHAKGDELVCLCELSLGNLTDTGRRLLEADEGRSAPQVEGLA